MGAHAQSKDRESRRHVAIMATAATCVAIIGFYSFGLGSFRAQAPLSMYVFSPSQVKPAQVHAMRPAMRTNRYNEAHVAVPAMAVSRSATAQDAMLADVSREPTLSAQRTVLSTAWGLISLACFTIACAALRRIRGGTVPQDVGFLDLEAPTQYRMVSTAGHARATPLAAGHATCHSARRPHALLSLIQDPAIMHNHGVQSVNRSWIPTPGAPKYVDPALQPITEQGSVQEVVWPSEFSQASHA